MREPVEQLFPRYSRVAYQGIKAALGTVMKGAYDLSVTGVENVPRTGPAILAANHISFIDSLLIPLAVPRRVTYLAKAEYWESWKTRWFFDVVGQIPVQRRDSEKAQAALEAAMRVLGVGGLLGIYPEGTRSPDGRLYRGKTGVARMAATCGCPVVPVGLRGTREIMPKEAKVPKLSGDASVTFGEPMHLSQAEVDADPMACRSFTDELMFRIMRMTGQEYVGEYADKHKHPSPARERTPAA